MMDDFLACSTLCGFFRFFWLWRKAPFFLALSCCLQAFSLLQGAITFMEYVVLACFYLGKQGRLRS
jgi:hypothetical protein